MLSTIENMPGTAERSGDAGSRDALRVLVCGAAGVGKTALLDGLRAERAQSAGSGVAWRRFATPQRAVIAADVAGDEQNIRDMMTGAARSDLAVLVVDAQNGLFAQTRRHAIIASLMGICHVVLAVNKMDLVGFERAVFDEICGEFRAFAGALGFTEVGCIPLSVRDGDNVAAASARMPWYGGPALRDYLDTAAPADERAAKPFRMPVESVDASQQPQRISGTLASGSLRVGDEIAVLPSGKAAKIETLRGPGGRDGAQAGDAVAVTLGVAIEVAPGDMLAAMRDRPQVADQFAAHVVWLSEEPLLPERSYLMTINDCTVPATVTELKHRVDVDTLAKLAAKTLGFNEIGVCNLALARPVPFDPHADNRETGRFILVDRDSDETVAVGMVDFVLRRATNIHHQTLTISKPERSALKQHRPAVLWFTGLSGAGKSTIGNLVEAALHERGVHTLMLDGDNIRHGLNRDLGFTEVDRVENIRRIGEVAKLMTDAGLIVLCSFISPFRAERRMVRELVENGEFIEVFVDTPLDECIARDPKGLYKRALAGEIKNFTGIDQPYEPPESAEVRLEAGRKTPDLLAQEVVEEMVRRRIL
jgi:bifunctional enzyme CysN/CysC